MAFTLPLKKRPIRHDFSDIDSLASNSPCKKMKMENDGDSEGRSSISSPDHSSLDSFSQFNHLHYSYGLAHHFHHHHLPFPLYDSRIPHPHPMYPLYDSVFIPQRTSSPVAPLNLKVYDSPVPSMTTSSSDLEEDKLVCPECRKEFTSRIRFRAHLRRHSSKTSGRYQCKECDKKFVQRSSLTTHMRIHTGERPFKCEECSDSFGDYSTFTKHQRTHTGEKPYPCPVCDRKFSQSGNMHRHLKAVHPEFRPNGVSLSLHK